MSLIETLRPPARPAVSWTRTLDRYTYLVTLVLCLVVVVLGLYGGDLAAQTFRVWLFRTNGFVWWDSSWYGGHADIGYGLGFPLVGALVGIIPAGVIACVVSTIAFCRLVPADGELTTTIARLWFAVGVVVDLVVGRLPFACGLACALLALVAMRAQRGSLVLVAAVACSLFSPLAALFLLIAAVACAPDIGLRRALPFGGAGVGLAIARLTGDGGRFPFPTYMLVLLLLLVAAGLLVVPSRQRVVRRGIVLYGLTCVVLFAWPNPVGGNVARLASLVAAPLLLVAAETSARRIISLLCLVLPTLLFWELLPVDGAIAASQHDASSSAAYYAGLVSYLEPRLPVGSRVEVLPTAEHWEATYVAEHVPIARGWDRQVDLGRNQLLYAPFTADAYRRWLADNAVAYVAWPQRTALDYGAKNEAAFLAHPPAWLEPVTVDGDWRLWKVVGAAPFATGAAHVTAVTPGGFSLRFTRPGVATVREHWSNYLAVDGDTACVEPTVDDLVDVVAQRAGDITVSAGLRADSDNRCPDGATGSVSGS